MNLTIIGAISKVLEENNGPLTIKTIYNTILDKGYYKFKAQNPYNVLRVELRRHCQGIEFASSSTKKHFKILNDGTYDLLKIESQSQTTKITEKIKKNILIDLKKGHTEYILTFKEQMLNQLKSIESDVFEIFCKKLLSTYGFKDLKVTRKSKDGGIDGYGKLKVGISYLNVAVQCKRWNKTSVGRTEIDKFRGAIQGDFEQGIFFTTSKFSKEAMQATTKKGAVPIIMIDGTTIIDIMIDKKLGVDVENLPIFINALDEVLNED
ncbi:restriction system protein [Dysgonomonas alginatilytica]|uniref:Restriction system protein n=1 Tax=Dysgonomonas alginatilytica TaxID=1605892 RepID=A0A2V3PS09_9BACT|nr:restriction endonuclease [Dysgonomonas alginatilytica]PXV61098.1 restriction system protein [Dysgonomonas alginatilytica]